MYVYKCFFLKTENVHKNVQILWLFPLVLRLKSVYFLTTWQGGWKRHECMQYSRRQQQHAIICLILVTHETQYCIIYVNAYLCIHMLWDIMWLIAMIYLRVYFKFPST